MAETINRPPAAAEMRNPGPSVCTAGDQCAGIPSRINPSRPHVQCSGNSTGLLAPCAHYVPLADASLARVDGKGTCLARVAAERAGG